MGVILNLTTPIKFSLTLINSDVQFILCKVYNRVNSSNITSQTWTHLQWGREGRKVAISKSPIFHVWIQAFDWLSVLKISAQSPSLLSLQYLKFSELIWFLRRHSFEIIILLWHFPYQKQNFLRKWFLVPLFSPIDSKLSNPYTKHVYLNIMFFNISYLGFALKIIAHFTGWGYSEPSQGFWVYLEPRGITPGALA